MKEIVVIFFFFKQKTAYEMRIKDWSSDVCSSDLDGRGRLILLRGARRDERMFYDTRSGHHGLPHDPFKACVVPRPIGWITTVNEAGVVNLAPYSFFNGVAGGQIGRAHV